MRFGEWGRRIVPAVAIGTFVAATGVAAQQPSDTVRAEVEALKRRVEALELQLAEQRALLERQALVAMEADALGEKGAEGEGVAVDPRQRLVSGIYGRPFVRRFGRGTALGGYVDLELEADLDSDDVDFDLHRFIPFIFAEITERIHFGTELEFEHGAEEIKIEFASLDVAFQEWLNVRGGIVLSPLGKFNLIHDSPVNDLTERPLVNRTIIPTTLSEAGLGVFGTLYPSELSVLTYEAYVVNGFDEGLVYDADAGALRAGPDVRAGRGSQGSDNNANKALVARLGYSPVLGLEVGGSIHTGGYAPRGGLVVGTTELLSGDERLTILALDGIYNRGPFEVLGEYARSSLDAPVGAPAAFATAQQGYYLQGNYHFGHGLVPYFDGSIFTAVARWDDVDHDTGRDGLGARRLTFGLNWRPVEETVFKLDLLNDWTLAADTGERSAARRRLFFS
ncbi:MAG: hypothetical protein GWN71_37445, partial [Gammaproteobacteria bacterium]|nr:hypothetical protein [Gemmatimonadota bacterium]NIU79035.1 hypothetical protein [Gammaproteobacteria bacterium]